MFEHIFEEMFEQFNGSALKNKNSQELEALGQTVSNQVAQDLI